MIYLPFLLFFLTLGESLGVEVQIKDAAADKFATSVLRAMSSHNDQPVKWTPPFNLIYTGERDGNGRTKPIPGDIVVTFHDAMGERGYVIVTGIISYVPGETKLDTFARVLSGKGEVTLRDAVYLGMCNSGVDIQAWTCTRAFCLFDLSATICG